MGKKNLPSLLRYCLIHSVPSLLFLLLLVLFLYLTANGRAPLTTDILAILDSNIPSSKLVFSANEFSLQNIVIDLLKCSYVYVYIYFEKKCGQIL